MKIAYIVALLMIVLLVGCATQEAEPAAPAAPVAPAEPTEPTEPAAPEAPAEEAAPASTDADEAHIDRLKPACERGAVQSCLVLKNSYGIDWPPPAEEPAATEGATE